MPLKSLMTNRFDKNHAKTFYPATHNLLINVPNTKDSPTEWPSCLDAYCVLFVMFLKTLHAF